MGVLIAHQATATPLRADGGGRPKPLILQHGAIEELQQDWFPGRSVPRAEEPREPPALHPVDEEILAVGERSRPPGKEDGGVVARDQVLRDEPLGDGARVAGRRRPFDATELLRERLALRRG